MKLFTFKRRRSTALPSFGLSVISLLVAGFCFMEISIKSKKHGDKTAYIDDEDYEKIKGYRWHLYHEKGKSAFYAISNLYSDGKHSTLRMHRMIMGAVPGIMIDHKDGNGLNNQKENLRTATNTENIRNCKISKNNTSGFKGVFIDKNKRRIAVSITVDRKQIHGGYFDTVVEAAIRYNELAIKYFSEFAKLNIIPCSQ